MRALVLAALVVAGVALTPAAPANAQVSPACLKHVAEEGTTPASDRAYHTLHGGESPCEEQQVFESTNNSDGKSRYCRKHWFC